MSALPLNKNYGSTSVYFRPDSVFKKIKLKLKSPFNTPHPPRVVLRQFSVMFHVCLLIQMATLCFYININHMSAKKRQK